MGSPPDLYHIIVLILCFNQVDPYTCLYLIGCSTSGNILIHNFRNNIGLSEIVQLKVGLHLQCIRGYYGSFFRA